MQRELVILSSSPAQPLFDDENQDESNKDSSTSISYRGSTGKRLKSGSHASKIPENAKTDFRLASALLSKECHEGATANVLAIATEVQEKANMPNVTARTEEQKKKRARRKRDDSTVNTGRQKKREADKTMTPDGGRARKNVRKGRTTGRVSAYFASGKESGDGKLVDVAADRTGSPPPRRRISWTPPRSNQPGDALDEGFVQISEFEYKDARAKASGFKSTFTIGRKIEVCRFKPFHVWPLILVSLSMLEFILLDRQRIRSKRRRKRRKGGGKTNLQQEDSNPLLK
jgi:hypothetical protein